VGGDDDPLRARRVLLDGGDEAAELVRQVPACRVRDVQRRGARLDDLCQDLVEVIKAGATTLNIPDTTG